MLKSVKSGIRLSEKNYPVILLLILSFIIIKDPISQFRRGDLTLETFVGDSVLYFSYLQSVFEDGDLQFADDYAELDANLHPNLKKRLPSGYTENIFPPGAAILWSPFYLYSKGYIALTGIENRRDQLNQLLLAVNVGTAVYGALFLVLVYRICRYAGKRWQALAAAITCFFASPVFYYVKGISVYSHAPAAFMGTLIIWLLMRKKPGERSLRYWFVIGLCVGLLASIRLMDILILFWILVEQLPILFAELRAKRFPARLFANYTSGAAGAFIGFLPALLVLWQFYGFGGTPLDTSANTLWLTHPRIFELLFSSRHGLFSWHPVLLLSLAGLILMLRQKPRGLGHKALLLFIVVFYVNASIGDWFSGASFGMRRIVSFSFLFGLGFTGILRVRPAWLRAPVVALLLAGILWNFTLYDNVLETNNYVDATPAEANPLNPHRIVHVNQWGQPLISPWFDVAAVPLGIDGKALDWLLSYELNTRQRNLEGRIEVQTPAYQQGFSEVVRDSIGPFRYLSSKGIVYFNLGFKDMRLLRIDISADLAGSTLPDDERAGLVIYVNDIPVGLLTERTTVNQTSWGHIFLKPKEYPWHFGLNSITIKCFALDREVRPKQDVLNDMFAEPSSYGLRKSPDEYTVMIRGIHFTK